jgi:hypothetical protein
MRRLRPGDGTPSSRVAIDERLRVGLPSVCGSAFVLHGR